MTGTSLRVGMGLSQIGEFSFIIAALGMTLQVTSDFLYPVAVAVSAITTLLTPYLIRAADPLSIKLGKVMPSAWRGCCRCMASGCAASSPRARARCWRR
jgi:CPA2 family monovalent cation:H+ antiporter-2